MTDLKESIGVRGHYRFIEADPRRAPEEYQALVDFLAMLPIAACETDDDRAFHRKEYVRLTRAYHAKAQIAVHEFDNLVPTVGRNVLARRLANNTTYTGIVNYAALGSGTTTPANTDTTLTTESYRKTIDSQTYVNNVAYLSVFIPAGTATAIHYEAGLFIDGTGTVDTGQIFSHVLLSPPVDKGALSSLTLDITLTIT